MKDIQRMAYDIPDWEHDGDTDYFRDALYRMGATNFKESKTRFDDPDYDDDDEEAYEVTLYFDVKAEDVDKFDDFGAYKV